MKQVFSGKSALRALILSGGAFLALMGCSSADHAGARQTHPPATPSAGAIPSSTPPVTSAPAAQPIVAAAPAGSPAAREAAQRALAFLAQGVGAWQEQHNCFGCHVQAVTLEAMVVGLTRDYRMPEGGLERVMHGMLDLPGGAHGPVGFSVGGSGNGPLYSGSQAFGGAAFAHYDEHIGPRVRDELLAAAGRLEELQAADGTLHGDERQPVALGSLQATVQAIQTWRQAYARTADERWLTPLRRAEDWLQGQASAMAEAPEVPDVKRLNYAIIGLLSAGGSNQERTLRRIEDRLRGLQQPDGRWDEGRAPALATGQAVYALRLLGASDTDTAVAKGMAWLLEHQNPDGGWGEGGARLGEGMWAILGLVSLHVASIEIAGVQGGAHVSGALNLQTAATDNGGGGVTGMQITIDDAVVASGPGAQLAHRLDTSGLDAGPHVIEVRATTADGSVSRRRVEIFAGDYFLTGVGTRFEGGATLFSLRNLSESRGQVRLEIFEAREQGTRFERGDRIHQQLEASRQGPMQLRWGGRRASGGALPPGRYVAELSYLDGAGSVRQSVEHVFVHDTAENRHAAFGQIAGNVGVAGGDVAENATVELLDEEGNVVRSTRATRSGQYQFSDVDQGSYQVRVRRQGFRSATRRVEAAPAAASQADMMLH
ncbi:MAG: carboxypeptidase regulatory-like domain-containing protein [Myxococcales bacterium]|nr:carboxypeptidase regulatory-like domain-containing protein [Myxococcales bacterium]